MKYDLTFKRHITRLFSKKIAGYNETRFLELELTDKCSHSCFFCGARWGSRIRHIDFGMVKNFLTTLYAEYCRTDSTGAVPVVSLVGGDPVLYTHFKELVLLLNRLKLPFVLKGNPSSIDAGLACFLKNNNCQAIKFTFLGNNVHNRVTGYNLAEAELEYKTKLFQSMGIPIAWNLTTGKFNLAAVIDALPFIEYVKPTGIIISRFAKIGKLKNRQDNDNIQLTPHQYRNFLLRILDFYYKNYNREIRLLFKEKLWFPLLVEEGLLDIENYNSKSITLGCDAYTRSLNVNVAGEVLLCGLLSGFKIGTITGSIPGFPVSEKMLSLDESGPCHCCRYRYYCRGCRAIAFADTGNLYHKDPQCWVK